MSAEGALNRIERELADSTALDAVSSEAHVNRDWLGETVATSLAEASFALQVIRSYLRPGQRVLEVGAGLGFTSMALAESGFDVRAIEPGGIGFDDYPSVGRSLAKQIGAELALHSIAIENLPSSGLGAFDLIFSSNVLEHVSDARNALKILDSSLSEGGLMLHVCPNYSFPFEPHFGLPLIPVAPAATRFILPSAITHTPLWQSLNFIKARDVASVGKVLNRSVNFHKGTMASMFERLDSEVEFRDRHPVLARLFGNSAWPKRLAGMVPASIASPMIFTWTQEAGPGIAHNIDARQ